jgi:molecular chaperone DnaJ
VRVQQGFFSIQQTCPTCHGTGKVIPDPCTACDGVGRVKKTKTLEVKIPAGIDDGMRIRSAGNGEPGLNGGPPGDLYVEIRVREHSVFQRDGDDLHCEVPIGITTAALGGKIEVPTLDGKAEIDLPEGTQSGKQFRLRGKGIKGLRASYPGDLYVHIAIETPVRLTEHQKKLLRELDASLKDPKHSPQHKGWMDRVKEFFQ